MIKGLSPEESRDLILSVGTHRGDRRLAPMEVAALVARAIAAGTDRRELARALGLRDTSMVDRFYRVHSLPLGVQDLVGWGRSRSDLSLSVAAEIASAPSEMREGLAAAAHAHRMSKEDVRGVVQRIRRGNETLKDAVESIVGMRPTTVRRYVLLGAIREPALRRVLAELDRDDRRDLMADAMSDVGIDAEGTLRASGFTLAREDDPFPNADVLEEAFNAALARRVFG